MQGESFICHLLIIASRQLVRASTDKLKENLGSFPIEQTNKNYGICTHKRNKYFQKDNVIQNNQSLSGQITSENPNGNTLSHQES